MGNLGVMIAILLVFQCQTTLVAEAAEGGRKTTNTTEEEDEVLEDTTEEFLCAETREENERNKNTIHRLAVTVVVLCSVAVISDSICIWTWRRKCSGASGYFLYVVSIYDLGHAVFLMISTVMRIRRERYSSIVITLVRSTSGYFFHGTTYTYLAMVVDRYRNLVIRNPGRLRNAQVASIAIAVILVPFTVAYVLVRTFKGRKHVATITYLEFLIVTCRVLPWVVTLACNVLLLFSLRRLQQRMTHSFLNRVGTGITATIVTSTFCTFLNIPVAQSYRLYNMISYEGCNNNVAVFVIFVLQIADHPINFLIYFVFVKGFRQTILRRIRKREVRVALGSGTFHSTGRRIPTLSQAVHQLRDEPTEDSPAKTLHPVPAGDVFDKMRGITREGRPAEVATPQQSG